MRRACSSRSEPITAAGLPPIITVGSSPDVIGALNGIGGPGWGAPVAGFGIWWIGALSRDLVAHDERLRHGPALSSAPRWRP